MAEPRGLSPSPAPPCKSLVAFSESGSICQVSAEASTLPGKTLLRGVPSRWSHALWAAHEWLHPVGAAQLANFTGSDSPRWLSPVTDSISCHVEASGGQGDASWSDHQRTWLAAEARNSALAQNKMTRRGREGAVTLHRPRAGHWGGTHALVCTVLRLGCLKGKCAHAQNSNESHQPGMGFSRTHAVP